MRLIAHIEVRYRCPSCKGLYSKQNEALKCRDNHQVVAERWAVGKDGKAVRIFDNCSLNGMWGENWALKEADLSDFIEVRKRQLAKE